MYFKLEPGNATYPKVLEAFEKIHSYTEQAQAVCKELGFERFGKSQRGIAGGISCLEANPKPEGYVSVGKKWQNLVYPRSNNKAALEKIKALPVMTYEEFGRAIGFLPQIKGLTHYRSCGFEKVGETYLIEVADQCDYTPAEGMVEILASEYKEMIAARKSDQVSKTA